MHIASLAIAVTFPGSWQVRRGAGWRREMI